MKGIRLELSTTPEPNACRAGPAFIDAIVTLEDGNNDIFLRCHGDRR